MIALAKFSVFVKVPDIDDPANGFITDCQSMLTFSFCNLFRFDVYFV